MMMRNRFDRQLENLNDMLIQMGSMCEDCISNVALALTGDRSETVKSPVTGMNERLMERVYNTDSGIDQMERDIEALCLKLLLQQQPVARDLRLISSALKMISDMERIGDQCSDIADIVKVMDKENVRKMESYVHIQDMATATMKMVTRAVDSFVSKDLIAARGVSAADDNVDELFTKVKNEISALISKYPDRGDSLLDMLMIAKYFERIGDHATNIAEWVEFSITGEHVKMN